MPSGHATRHHLAGVRTASHPAGLPGHPRNPALVLEKPPAPVRSNTLTCVRAQLSRYTRPFRARPRPCTLRAATGPARLPPPPTSQCPPEGRCRLPRRPIPGTPTARGRALGTSRAQPPPPSPAFPPSAPTPRQCACTARSLGGV